MTARVHPGESNSSHMMEGFLKFITGQSLEAKDLRRKFVFKVVPMLNPDGVISGNYRTSFSGNDLNRFFETPDPALHPEPTALRKLISQISSKSREPDPIAMYLDMHGHSRKKSVFIYGPEFPITSPSYLKSRIFAQLLSENSEMFRFQSCKYQMEQSKRQAARCTFARDWRLVNCFTLEASMHAFFNPDRQTVEFT
jgi:hypothetical protein